MFRVYTENKLNMTFEMTLENYEVSNHSGEERMLHIIRY